MQESRAAKYGRNFAIWINYTISDKNRFVLELKNYSFEPRKKGQPLNHGCVRELEGIDKIDMENPEDLARLVKEGIHLMYQKDTASRVITALLENLT